MRIGIAGAGSVAFGTATLLHANGQKAMLWSPSGAGTEALKDAPLRAMGAIEAAAGICCCCCWADCGKITAPGMKADRKDPSAGL